MEIRIISVSKNKLPTSTKRGTMMTGQAFVAQKKVKSEKYYNEIGGETRFRGEFGMTIISTFFDVLYPLIFHAHIHTAAALYSY